jgi:uncharacterized protein YbjT (DUF2867 family)
MKHYAVIGASNGTGHAIAELLAARGDHVTAISRKPTGDRPNVFPVAADVQDAASLVRALPDHLDTVFFTVDIHGFRKPKNDIYNVMVRGCNNAVEAAIKRGARRFVLLSVIGAEDASWVWWLLNAVKPGIQENLMQREQALKHSGLPYIIVRAPKLDDSKASEGHVLAQTSRQKLGMKQSISRRELASLMVLAADAGPEREGATWDVAE